jgi:hypothetical protein
MTLALALNKANPVALIPTAITVKSIIVRRGKIGDGESHNLDA